MTTTVTFLSSSSSYGKFEKTLGRKDNDRFDEDINKLIIFYNKEVLFKKFE